MESKYKVGDKVLYQDTECIITEVNKFGDFYIYDLVCEYGVEFYGILLEDNF